VKPLFLKFGLRFHYSRQADQSQVRNIFAVPLVQPSFFIAVAVQERYNMKKQAIGFIGLGVMGKPMARNLASAGHLLAVYDIRKTPADQISQEFERVRAVESPKQVAELSDIVISMLPAGNHVQDVIQGKNGLIAGYRPGSLHLDTSSAEPWLTKESAAILKDHGVAMVDAPVSGAEPGAQKAELVFMAGGNKQDVARVAPLFQAMG
jgi:3-hydroxyisobutyrate dehydrogenase-like beta-hydroxyacid dehydrogenase